MTKKQLRSRWCHKGDAKLIRTFVDMLNKRRDEETIKDKAIVIRNFSEHNFFVADLKVVKNRKRVDLHYAARGNLCAPGRNQVITFEDIGKS